MRLIKKTLNAFIMIAMSGAFFFLAQEFVKEAETYREVNYADVKGCTPEDHYFKWCT